MSLVIPRTQVSQVIEQLVAPAVATPRFAVVVGPNYAVHKYSAAAKAAIRLGAYANADVAFAWPGRQAGEVVDHDFTSLFIDDAKLKFFEDDIGSGSDIAPVAGFASRIHAASLVWAGNAAAARSAAIPADVLPGDYVEVTNGTTTLKSYVSQLIADIVAPVVNAPGLTGLTATQVAAAVVNKVTTVSPSTLIMASSAASYDGSVAGAVTDTYTITVKTAGLPAAARLTITSRRGDNIDNVVPVLTTPMALGSRGATITFSGDTNFEAGEVWTVAVTQGYTRPTIVAGGTFQGDAATTYVATVVQGGPINGLITGALVLVSTLTNSDYAAAVPVSLGTATQIGTLGVTLTFTGANSKLVAGDTISIAVTPQTQGALSTLQLENNLPLGLLTAPDLRVTVAIEKNIEVLANRIGHAPLHNWTQSDTQISLKAGILANDARVMTGSTLTDLAVIGGTAYAQYRALKTSGANVLGVVTPARVDVAGAVLGAFGTTDVDAVLPFGVMCAAENSAGVDVHFIAVGSDNLAGYQAALASIAQTNPGWSFVPLSHDAAVQSLFRTTVNSRSSAASAKWCVTWLGGVLATQAAVATKRANGTPLLATITDDTDSAGNQYVIVTDELGTFLANGVKAGDVLRGSYGSDGFGGSTYAEYIIDAVLANESIRLISGPNSPISLAAKYEIWRPLSVTEQAAAYGAQYGVGDRRVRAVFPANPKRAGTAYPNYFLAASLAGQRSGVLPHQPLSSVQLLGWDDMSESSVTFADQLETLMNLGIWVVTQEFGTALVYTLRQVTTDVSDLRNTEDSVVSNIDSISEVFTAGTRGITGRGNLTDSILSRVGALLDALVETMKVVKDANLGPQVVDATRLGLTRSVVLRDHALARYSVTVPTPFNNLDIVIEAVV